MKQLKTTVDTTLEIEKSKFITYLIPIQSLDQASASLLHIKKLHPKATHHCSALIFDDVTRSNDDGEPASTAGLPMLQTLKSYHINHVLAVVVRYFGGVLLGKGGLIRAYSQSVSHAIAQATWYDELIVYRVQLQISYDLMNVIETTIPKFGEIIERQFSSMALFTVLIPSLDVLAECQVLTAQQIEILSTKQETILVKAH